MLYEILLESVPMLTLNLWVASINNSVTVLSILSIIGSVICLFVNGARFICGWKLCILNIQFSHDNADHDHGKVAIPVLVGDPSQASPSQAPAPTMATEMDALRQTVARLEAELNAQRAATALAAGAQPQS
jgi:hypothetical protein